MEAVRAFNNELSGLYECKPPISRAKMAQVTKSAIKAIKFYKHVVQSVEKFIQKCKPEYKVPGLYVIDSVVRQSRHQFGANKDVFSPRFTKNLVLTFQNLFKCSGDDRSRLVRVLNLWQKNQVFPSEIVQPLLDMAADPTNPSNIAAAQRAVDELVGPSKPNTDPRLPAAGHGDASQEEEGSGGAADSMLATQNDMLNTVTQLLQQTDGVGGDHGQTSLSQQQQQLQQLQLLQQQLIQQTQLMQQPNQAGAPIIDSNLLAQIQTLTNQLLSKTEREAKQPDTGFNTKLLDFDYGESDDEEGGGKHHRHHQPQSDSNLTGNVQTILNDPTLMQQIQHMTETIEKTEQLKTELGDQEKLRQQLLEQQQADLRQQVLEQQQADLRQQVLEQQQAEFDQQIQNTSGPAMPPQQFGHPEYMEEQQQRQQSYEEEGPKDEDFREHHAMKDREDRDHRDRSDRRRRSRDRSRDRSRTPKRRRRSRSRSRDRRRRSRSRDRHRRSRSKDKERERQKEKERERKKAGLPPIRERYVTVCTTTVWIGHLNKYTHEEEVRQELEKYGSVESINMVPPRGCAYAVMTNRKEAYKAIDRLKGFKLNGSALKTAWAQSTAIRESDYKDRWDLDLGALFLPWDKLPADLAPYLEGAIIDQESLPEHLKDIPTKKIEAGDGEPTGQSDDGQPDNAAGLMGQHPMMGQMPGMMPQMAPGGMMPRMMPHMMMQMQQRPGLPPQGMAPGGPGQMIPGAPRPPIPGMPGLRPAVAPGTQLSQMSSTVANSLPPALVATSGVMPSAAAGMPRPGFPPVPQSGYNFNPNMPPPGFRLPMRPGFMGSPRPLTPGLGGPEGKPGERGPAPGVAWPPDSNEMDDDDDAEESPEKATSPRSSDSDKFTGVQFGGMSTPGKFPPMANMPGNWPRMAGGPEGMMGGPPRGPNGMPLRGPGPDMFNSPQGPMGMRPGFFPPGGPRFMGNRPGMPGGPGMMRFPPGFQGPPRMGGPPGMMGGPPMRGPGLPMRGPVSLLDLDIKPTENFEGERFGLEDDEEDEGPPTDLQQMYKDSDEFALQGEEEDPDAESEPAAEEAPKNCYLANPWKSIGSGSPTGGGRNEESDERNNRGDRSYDKDRTGGRDQDSDRRRSHRSDFDRSDDSDRRERERVRQKGGHRGRDDWETPGRNDRDSDRDRRGRNDRRERDRDRDRGRDDHRRDRDRRVRSSRWSNVDENTENGETTENAELEMPVLENENTENEFVPEHIENIGTVENGQNDNTENENIHENDENVNANIEYVNNENVNANIEHVNDENVNANMELVNDEAVNANIAEESVHEAGETADVAEDSIHVGDTGVGGGQEDGDVAEVPLAPVDTNITPSKLESLKPTDIPPEGQLPNNDTNDLTANAENVDLEEGEISS